MASVNSSLTMNLHAPCRSQCAGYLLVPRIVKATEGGRVFSYSSAPRSAIWFSCFRPIHSSLIQEYLLFKTQMEFLLLWTRESQATSNKRLLTVPTPLAKDQRPLVSP